jgi:hypothetical protein
MAGLQDSFHANVPLLATFWLMLEYVYECRNIMNWYISV